MSHNTLVSCVSFIICLIGFGHATVVTTSGDGSGIPCGKYLCVPQAFCSIDSQCVCTTGSGDGYLKCFASGRIGTYLTNTIKLVTYDEVSVNLALPCRYEVTKLTTTFMDANDIPSGKCELSVRGFNKKDKGRFYVHGFDTAVQIHLDNGTVFKMSVREFGTADNGEYVYQVNATQGTYNVDGPFKDDNPSFHDSNLGLSIVESVFDMENNIGKIRIPPCGVFIIFRAYDSVLRRNQRQVPGLSININNDTSPSFINNTAVLSLVPSSETNAISMFDLPLQSSNLVNILNRALVSNITQNNPDANAYCSETGLALEGMPSSNQTVSAYNRCLWILRSSKFINCFDNTRNGNTIMQLFLQCIGIEHETSSCAEVIATVSTSGCQGSDSNNVDLQSFIDGDLC